MNKRTLILLVLAVPLLTIGAGCTRQNISTQTSQIPPISTKNNCAPEGQRPDDNVQCCTGLELIAVDNAYEVCGKPGNRYKPKTCMTEGETPFIDTPDCCDGLELIMKGNKYICTKI